MTRKTRKRLILSGVAVAVVALVIYGFLPDARLVDTAVVERGPLEVIVEEEGETQIAETYVLSAPVAAYVRRIDVEPGDFVTEGQPVVRLEAPRSAILDPRTETQARARIAAAESAVEQARQNAVAAAAAAEEAEEERERMEGLFEEESATQQQLTRARSAAQQAQANLQSAQAAVETARAELVSARAALEITTATANRGVSDVLYAPVSGQVLAVHQESAGQVSAGEPLVDIGNVDNLDVYVDVLSQDAVRIVPGTRVLLDQWGGETVLEASVTRIDPRGFTEVSSLGVEEKRVRVVAQLSSPPEGLGAGYRVLARFVVWEGDDVLVVPTSALFRTESGWGVFVIDGGEAAAHDVEIGRQTGLSAQVLSGLEEGDVVIVHPPNDLEEGTRVEPRE